MFLGLKLMYLHFSWHYISFKYIVGERGMGEGNEIHTFRKFKDMN